MKNYFKKFSIMFVMALIMMLGCCVNAFASGDFEMGTVNLNNTAENSAKVDDVLKKPEKGWKRYDDTNPLILYYDKWDHAVKRTNAYQETITLNGNIVGKTLEFEFYGTKLRLLTVKFNDGSGANVKIDGVNCGDFSSYAPDGKGKLSCIFFEKLDLTQAMHKVLITTINANTIAPKAIDNYFALDAIDIDDSGYLVNPNKSISLNKLTDNLQLGQTDNLVATTTPVGTEVTWKSSDESIATVDSNGKVTGVKEGQATITAQIKDTDIKSTCEVTVTKAGTTEPTNPPVDEPTTGDGTLYIEMLDGNIKQAQDLDVDDFIKWFKNRYLDNNDNPIYKIKNAKGNVEYLVHDKVVGFEVR